MRIGLLLLGLAIGGLSGCASIPAFQACVIYKGKRLCASKLPDGTWAISGDLSPEDRAEVEDILKGGE